MNPFFVVLEVGLCETKCGAELGTPVARGIEIYTSGAVECLVGRVASYITERRGRLEGWLCGEVENERAQVRKILEWACAPIKR